MRVFAVMVFLAGGAFAQGVMPANDGVLWQYTLPGRAFYHIWERPSNYTNYSLYASLSNNCSPYGSRRLPSGTWMRDMTRESLERFKAGRWKDQWTISPYFKEVGEPPTTESAVRSWNPRTWIKDYLSLDGGILWPDQIASTNSAGRAVEDEIAGIFRRLGFEVGDPAPVDPWGTNITELVVKGLKEYESVETCVGSGWRVLSPYVAKALDRLFEKEGDYWVAWLGDIADPPIPKIPVVVARWRATTKLEFEITEKDGKWSVEAKPEYVEEYSEETNMVDIVAGGGVSLSWGGDYSGDLVVPLAGPVVVGFPRDTSSTNLAKIGTSTTLDGMECWRVEVDDIVGVDTASAGEISATYEASWILELGAPTGRLVNPVGDSVSIRHPNWGVSDYLFNYPFATGYGYVPRRVWRQRWTEDDPGGTEEFRDVQKHFASMAAEWQETLGPDVFRDEIPDEAFEERRHTPQAQTPDSEAKVVWDNVGAVHYYTKTEPPVHMGFRLNGESYGEGKFHCDSDGNVLHTSLVLGWWTADTSAGILRAEGECRDLSGRLTVTSALFAIYHFSR